MAKIFTDRVMVAIDVGTTKICVIVAQQVDTQLEVFGVGKAPSHGLKKGVVVDVAKTVHAIKAAVQEAELMSGLSITTAYVGVSGGHIQSLNSHGVVPIKRGQVTQQDIQAVMAAAQAIPIPEGQQILHVLPQYFVIDGNERIQDPLGMHGIRLEVETHIILGAIASVQNIIKCCELAGVNVADIILEQLASADAVLSADECDLGVGVLDIGGGTCDFAIYQNGNIRHTMVLPVAGNHFTHDIAIGLRTTIKDAERIKIAYGLASNKLLLTDDLIEVEAAEGSTQEIVQRSDLVAILDARAHEVMHLIHAEVNKRKLKPYMSSGLVLTGGGSLLHGLVYVATEIFDMPVRIGKPRSEYVLPDSLDSPIYATAYGLLVHALKKQVRSGVDTSTGPLSQRIVARMKAWVADFF